MVTAAWSIMLNSVLTAVRFSTSSFPPIVRRGRFISFRPRGAPRKLADVAPGAPWVFSPDGSRVLYTSDIDGDGKNDAVSVASSGGPAVKLNLSPGGEGGLFSPDGSRVIYTLFGGLFVVPSIGGTPVNVSAAAIYNSPQYSPDGSRLIFTQQVNGIPQLFVRVMRQQWDGANGDWDALTNWSHGKAPDEVMQITIDGSASVTVSGNAMSRTLNELQLGGGDGTSMLTFASDAAITAINGVVINSGGVLGGNGSIVGSVVNTGIISPGASPGSLTIDGEYSQSAAGQLQIELAGTNNFDQLLVTGTATLGGVLDVSLLDFLPRPGETFEFLTATDGLSGRFDRLLLPELSNGLRFDVRYSSNSAQLAVVGVPEPSTLLMAALAVAPLTWRRRRDRIRHVFCTSVTAKDMQFPLTGSRS